MKTEVHPSLLEMYIIAPQKKQQKKESWDWKQCIIKQKKGKKKESISLNIDALLYNQ